MKKWNEGGHHRCNGYISAGAAVVALLLTLCPPGAAKGVPRACAWILSVLVVCWADIYSVRLIYACAFWGDHPEDNKERWPGLPKLLPALVAVPLIFIALVFAFASLYSLSGQVVISNTSTTGLDNPLSFAYFSLVTMATLGYGDIVPKDVPGRVIVIVQLLSGLLFLLMTFPVLASRLATALDQPANKSPSGKREIEIKKVTGGLEISGVDSTPTTVSSCAKIEIGTGARFVDKDGVKIE